MSEFPKVTIAIISDTQKQSDILREYVFASVYNLIDKLDEKTDVDVTDAKFSITAKCEKDYYRLLGFKECIDYTLRHNYVN